MMTTYLLIGFIIQMLIIGIRTIRGVADWSDFTIWTLLGIVIMSVINILLWPITVIAEIINTIRGY